MQKKIDPESYNDLHRVKMLAWAILDIVSCSHDLYWHVDDLLKADFCGDCDEIHDNCACKRYYPRDDDEWDASEDR